MIEEAVPHVAPRTITGLSICTGSGMLDVAVTVALPEARAVCFVENEITAARFLAARFEEGGLDETPIWSDVRTFDPEPWGGLVDIIFGGYPCQPFSVAGRQRGTDDPRHLWPHIARIVEYLRPRACFFENVEGHLRVGYFDVVRPDLERIGYRVAEGLYTAEEVGAPHRRERLFILAHREAEDAESAGNHPDATDSLTGAADGWPTPRAMTGGPESAEWKAALGRTESGGGDLQSAVINWPTPDTQNNRDGTILRTEARDGSVHAVSLHHAASQWATPRAAEYKGTGPVGSKSHAYRLDRGYLDAQAETFSHLDPARPMSGPPSPPSSDPPYPDSISPTLRSDLEQYRRWSIEARTRGSAGPSPRSFVRRSLNPAFVGWLMGMARAVDSAVRERVDALRLTGNGVVPLTAAFAFADLARRLGVDIDEPDDWHV